MILVENPRQFNALCQFAFSLGNLRIKFNKKRNTVTIEKCRPSTCRPNWKYYFSPLLVCIYALQCFWKKRSTLVENVLVENSLIILLIGQVYIHQLPLKQNEIVFFLNGLFRLHSLYPNTGNSQSSSGLGAFVNIVMVTGIVFPIGFAYGQHWKNLCKSTLIGFWLIPRCT